MTSIGKKLTLAMAALAVTASLSTSNASAAETDSQLTSPHTDSRLSTFGAIDSFTGEPENDVETSQILRTDIKGEWALSSFARVQEVQHVQNNIVGLRIAIRF